MKQQLDFFLGALSPTGFCGYYSSLLDQTKKRTTALLEAGPGCGKSTVLQRLCDTFLAQNESVQAIHSASDAASLDGVICPARNFCALDANAPHALEPRYPGAFEVVISLYDAANRAPLFEHREEIIALFTRCAGLTERALRYITAAGSLLQDTSRAALCCTDLGKAHSFADALGRRYIQGAALPIAQGGANEDIRLLSAVTAEGIEFYADTIPKLADTIVVFDDEFGLAAKTILQDLRLDALAKGHDILTCYCSMSPFEKIDHLFIPALRLAFVTSNDYHRANFENQRVIHCTRFCNAKGLALRRKRLRFNKKAAAELLAQAVNMQREAKICHDELEKYYHSALDTTAVDAAYAKIAALI